MVKWSEVTLHILSTAKGREFESRLPQSKNEK